jgi:mono/diheme cytochrome c family protein
MQVPTHRVCQMAFLLFVCGAGATGAQPVDATSEKRGEYLARAGDCVACHTAPGGRPMAGGVQIPTPLGAIVSTNITPSKTNGIGNYNYQQFADALRRGIRADGAHLYPAMPYTAYARVTDEDVRDLYEYFMHAVEPVDASPPETMLPFPFNIRLSMAGWNLLFLDDATFRNDPARSTEWNRGSYLTQGLAHCGACHSPRNLLMAEASSRQLGGAMVGPWNAPNITSDPNSGVGGWTVAELITYLHDGHAVGKAQAAGPMAEAVDNSLRHLTEADLGSIAAYLKTVPAIRDRTDTQPTFSWGRPANDLQHVRGHNFPANTDDATGPQLYDAYCSSCHQANGEGSFDGRLAPLIHNSALGRADSNNLAIVILEGLHREPDVFMPRFANVLSDRQIATLSTYLLQRFGNPQGSVSEKRVSELRSGGAASNLALIIQLTMGLAAVMIAGLLFAFLRHPWRPSQNAHL